jgi:hypothetical protein
MIEKVRMKQLKLEKGARGLAGGSRQRQASASRNALIPAQHQHIDTNSDGHK